MAKLPFHFPNNAVAAASGLLRLRLVVSVHSRAIALSNPSGERLALIALMPLTGRTHQLRVHMAALGTPILGDGKYGGKAAFMEGLEVAKRLHLHARRIALPHPSGTGSLDITADPPQHMVETLTNLGLDSSEANQMFAKLP